MDEPTNMIVAPMARCNLADECGQGECFHRLPHIPGKACESGLCVLYKINGRKQRCECVPVEEEK